MIWRSPWYIAQVTQFCKTNEASDVTKRMPDSENAGLRECRTQRMSDSENAGLREYRTQRKAAHGVTYTKC